MPLRDRLTYSNVVATLALVVAVGTGGAYAAGEIGSRDIDNNSIRSIDLKNRHAVRGRDVKRNALTGREVDEASLRATQFIPMASDRGGTCDPTDPVFRECAAATLDLGFRARLFIVGTGEYFSAPSGAGGLSCRISLDDTNTGATVTPGETGGRHTDLAATDGFALTHMTGAVAAGSHEVALDCSEPGLGDGRLASSSIAVLGISR